MKPNRNSPMTLDHYRNVLDTDARRRCEAQEKTIKDLRAEIKQRDDTIKRLRALLGSDDADDDDDDD